MLSKKNRTKSLISIGIILTGIFSFLGLRINQNSVDSSNRSVIEPSTVQNVQAYGPQWYTIPMKIRFSKNEVKNIHKRSQRLQSGASLAGFIPKLGLISFYFGGAWGNVSEPFNKAYYRGTGLTIKYTLKTQGTAASNRIINLKYIYE